MKQNIYYARRTVAAMIVVVAVLTVWHLVAAKKTVEVAEVPQPKSPTYYSAFDGLPVEKAGIDHPRVLGVMIDNHPDAWPQAGVSAANIVYEVPVEGGLTRYLALYTADQNVIKIGPVRSARPYFLDWLAEYGDAAYFHCGGSPDALALIDKLDVWDVNQFYFDQYFWRAANRVMPHNLYTNSDHWQTLLQKHSTDHINTTWQGFSFATSTDVVTSGQPIKAFSIQYNPTYAVRWQYDPQTKWWQRYINGKAAQDEDGSVPQANNIIIEKKQIDVLDEEGRRSVTTVGTGETTLIQFGKMIKGTWRKDTRTSRTRYFDATGKELSLQPGKTWVEVIPLDVEITLES